MEPGDLYGLPLDRFVAERGALAKALRAEGRREEAAEVAALKKPSVAAWAVNQIVRTQKRPVGALFEAGDALRTTQEELLAGRGDARTLRAAAESERGAVEALVEAARGLLTSEGHELSTAVVERVSETLHAAALDDSAREQVREGRLVRELRHIGFGLGEAAGAGAPGRRASKSKAAGKAPAAKASAAKPRARGARAHGRAADGKRNAAARKRDAAERERTKRDKRERDQARKAARTAELAARRRVERAATALEAAEERRERAAQRLADADAALAGAREEAEAAAAEHARARADLERG